MKKAEFSECGKRFRLRDSKLIPRADAYLWNYRMFLQMDYRGKALALFNQPEHAFYAEDLRSFYLRDLDSGEIWSVPFDPVCNLEQSDIVWDVGISDIVWVSLYREIEVTLRVFLPLNDCVELWSVEVRNLDGKERRLSLTSYFPFGFRSWLHNSTRFDIELNGVYYDCFPYYADYRDFERLGRKKNDVVVLASETPHSFECAREAFQGLSGLHAPAQLNQRSLSNGLAYHEYGIAALQYEHALSGGGSFAVKFAFGPVQDEADARRLKETYLAPGAYETAWEERLAFHEKFSTKVTFDLPAGSESADFAPFLNHWLPNQLTLGGITTRMELAPHTRNTVIDALGMLWISPERSRELLLRVYAFQQADGTMPMGIQIDPEVPLNAMRKVFHRDNNVWGPLVLKFYLEETGDFSILDQQVAFEDSDDSATLFDHITRGLEWQWKDRSERGLSLMGEGDWNDPLNMVGYQGKGESVWLTQALSAALQYWAEVSDWHQHKELAAECRARAEECNRRVNELAWDGKWYLRAFSDEGIALGTHSEQEGRMYLNPQSWGFISHSIPEPHKEQVIESVHKELMTPWGPHLLAPAYTKMQPHIGRICQKSPGYAENGSMYCHAALFYVHGLYEARRSDDAWDALSRLYPGLDEAKMKRAAQAPLYVPSLFHGIAMGQHAGSTNHYFRTGSCTWFHMVFIYYLAGLKGTGGGLWIDPQLPKSWDSLKVTREFRGATFEVSYQRDTSVEGIEVVFEGSMRPDQIIPRQEVGSVHQIEVRLGVAD